MRRRSFLTLALSSAAVLAAGMAGPGRADAGYRISGPHVHANLAVYFVHGKSETGPVPLTLQEAMARGAVVVHETGSVNELQIENLGSEEVFVQSGDIVKGGKQDRVLMVSLVLPPKSGRLPIASFCVEQGRWSARGREDVTRFSSANAALPSRRAKLAMKAPLPAVHARQGAGDTRLGRIAGDIVRGRPHHADPRGTTGGVRQPAARSETSVRQQAVWRSVAETQHSLSSSVGQPVAAPQSQSSLQLSLENAKVKEVQAAYVKALKAEGEKADDIVGYVFAINGKINSADVYPSNALFRKMWAKLLTASVAEAVGERGGEAGAPPAAAAVSEFLQKAERGEASERALNKTVKLETRESENALYFSTARAGGGWVHRNYLAK